MKFNELDTSTKIILKVIFAVLALLFLWVTREIILILLLSLILASALDPLVGYLNKKKIPRAASILVVYLLIIGLVGLVIYLFIPPLIEQLKVLQGSWPRFVEEFHNRIANTPFAGIDISQALNSLVSGSGGQGSVLNKTFGVFNGLLSLLTVLVVSFYLVAEEKGMKKFIASFVPAQHQGFVINLTEQIQKKMGLWVLGQVIISVIIFLVTFIGLKILGVQYALFLGLLAGLLEVVPYLGPILSSIPSIFFAFIQSPPLAIAVVLLYIAIQKTENYVLTPKVMEKTVGMSPLLVLVALLVGFKLAGIVGLLIAVPLAGALTVVINEFSAVQQAKVKSREPQTEPVV